MKIDLIQRTSVFLATLFVSVALIGCSSDAAEELNTDAANAATEDVAPPSIPDPSGTYSDSEGGLAFTFLSTGKFYQELLGETTFGSWTRYGNEATITYDDGSSANVMLGDGYIEFNGMRLNK